MGVPAFFRWLSKKYSAIVVHCNEEKEKVVDGVRVPVNISDPNPNEVEFDNLYLDMNGIIHPCCHPENKPAPKNEDEMMVLIFEYIDRLMQICRPRKLLYMAIDGVAPRAKMNQQRSRRFRASKESGENKETMSRIREEILSRGGNLPPPKPPSSHFDSNCITPGTEFMFRLADCLRYYVTERLNNNPGWANLKVILSDANAPGEGEHKIMDYIRRQRAQPDHDPNTHHCLCGADADLIMLGLATHEPYFTIIREEFKPNQKRPCELCGQVGHELKECEGLPKEKMGEHDELAVSAHIGEETQFIFLRLNILREYLEKELWMTGLPFTFDMERAIDDWVFMCFFVGNDFLPHLPSLEIREGAIDRLIRLYKKAVYKTKGYLTENGIVNLSRVQLMLSDLGEAEDDIFVKRRDTELGFRRRNKEKKARMAREQRQRTFVPGGMLSPQPLGRTPSPSSARDIKNARQSSTSDNMKAAASLGLASPGFGSPNSSMTQDSPYEKRGSKRKHEEVDEDEEADKTDTVRLWESGWKERYYENKFDVGTDDIEFRDKVVAAYVSGLCWVLQYYYQGCPSWNWYFPFHYAPFASDFINIERVPNMFPKGTKPFKPLEQLMSVFPAASGNFIPESWRELMSDIDSPIIDFYPLNFKIDLNGKKYAWQGVALLPFVEEKRLLSTLEEVYPTLLAIENKRNSLGPDRLFVGKKNALFSFFHELYNTKALERGKQNVDMNPELADGMRGMIGEDEFVTLPGRTHRSPVPGCFEIANSQVLCVTYLDPQYEEGHLFQANQLPGAKPPGKVLKPEDFEEMERQGRGQRGRGRGRGRGGFGSGRGGFSSGRGGWRPQLGFTPGSGYRDNKNADSANRMIRGNMASQQGSSPYGRSNYGGTPQGGQSGYGGTPYQDTRRSNQGQGANSAPGGWGGNYSQQQRSYGQDRYSSGGSGYQSTPTRGYDNYGSRGGGSGGGGRGGYNDRQQGYGGGGGGGHQRSRSYDQQQSGQQSYPRPPGNNQRRNYNNQGW